jgi:hypothetical protein
MSKAMRAKFQKRISQTLYTIQAVALEPPYQIVNADDRHLTWTFHRWEIAQWGRRPKSGGPALCCTLSRPVRFRALPSKPPHHANFESGVKHEKESAAGIRGTLVLSGLESENAQTRKGRVTPLSNSKQEVQQLGSGAKLQPFLNGGPRSTCCAGMPA